MKVRIIRIDGHEIPVTKDKIIKAFKVWWKAPHLPTQTLYLKTSELSEDILRDYIQKRIYDITGVKEEIELTTA